jgi:hypothetical protein
MDANYTITEFFIENRNPANSLGSRSKTHRTSQNYSEKVSSCQNCLKISHRRTFSFCMTKKCGIYGYNCNHHRILDKEPNDELCQNFIHDKMQLHTSTRSELNLIKSVIYIYTYNLFIFIF